MAAGPHINQLLAGYRQDDRTKSAGTEGSFFLLTHWLRQSCVVATEIHTNS